MDRYEWLNSKENQDEVYDLLRYTLEELKPDEPGELALAEGMYWNYVELAVQGDVELDNRRRPFNIAGAEDVVATWLIPLVVEVANSIIIAAGIYSLKKSFDHLRQRSNPSTSLPPSPSRMDEVRECIQQALDNPAFKIDQESREHIEKALVQAILLLLT